MNYAKAISITAAIAAAGIVAGACGSEAVEKRANVRDAIIDTCKTAYLRGDLTDKGVVRLTAHGTTPVECRKVFNADGVPSLEVSVISFVNLHRSSREAKQIIATIPFAAMAPGG